MVFVNTQNQFTKKAGLMPAFPFILFKKFRHYKLNLIPPDMLGLKKNGAGIIST